MDGTQKGEAAQLLLTQIKAGKPLNHNQKAMLREFHLSEHDSEIDITETLGKHIRHNPPRYAVMPDSDEGY